MTIECSGYDFQIARKYVERVGYAGILVVVTDKCGTKRGPRDGIGAEGYRVCGDPLRRVEAPLGRHAGNITRTGGGQHQIVASYDLVHSTPPPLDVQRRKSGTPGMCVIR